MQKILLLDIENIVKKDDELLKLFKEYSKIYLVYATGTMNIKLDHLLTFSKHIQSGKLHIIKMPKVGKDAADFGLAFVAGQLSKTHDPKQYHIDIMSNDKALQYVADLLALMKFSVQRIKTFNPNNYLNECIKFFSGNQPKNEVALNNVLKSRFNLTEPQIQQLIQVLTAQQILHIEEDSITWLLTTSQKQSQNAVQLDIPTSDELKQKSNLQHIKRYCDYLITLNARPAKKETLLKSIRRVLKNEDEQLVSNTYDGLHECKIVTEQNNKIVYDTAQIQAWANLKAS
ncbi:MAG: PIN domain-containing protein [Acinetobacter sp.]|nr:PIN domain-containing protein [Acinetobacter sp.]